MSGQSCVPFVSQYTDCTDNNKCTGCHQCSCSAAGRWQCRGVRDCAAGASDTGDLGDRDVDDALTAIRGELKNKYKSRALGRASYRPPPPHFDKRTHDVLTEPRDTANIEDAILSYMRQKRSAKRNKTEKKHNDSITFHHVVDELNEDTLKHSNASGTIQAAKVDMIPHASRRTGILNETSKSLQIEYTPTNYNHHMADNKVDTTAIHDDKLDLLVHHQLPNAMKNKTADARDKELSKLLVNELKGGSETIGDATAPVISNITFTPENDTLTAMAFIAGNLLNQLWNMEKDKSDDNLEIEAMKQKKVNDLLELFKEPLEIRQEQFLRNALQYLSKEMEGKDKKNKTFCEDVEDFKKMLPTKGDDERKKDSARDKKTPILRDKANAKPSSKNKGTTEALNKLGSVMELIEKYDSTFPDDEISKSNINYVRKASNSSSEDKTTLNVFGNLLHKLTKLLLPHTKAKKITDKVNNVNVLKTNQGALDKLSSSGFEIIGNMSPTAKDKLILDYLAHVQSNPGCLLNKKEGTPSMPAIEGDILLNLSEFFKIKSMSDLLKLVEPKPALRKPVTTTESSYYTTMEAYKQQRIVVGDDINKFQVTKDKLKIHLKSIFDDLVELQSLRGQSPKGKMSEIVEILPCIYNLVNGNKHINQNMALGNKDDDRAIDEWKLPTNVGDGTIEPEDRIAEVFDDLKRELKQPLTRRAYVEPSQRPKSAVVWERTIKNLRNKVNTRRNMYPHEVKSLDAVRALLEKVYKAFSPSTFEVDINDVPIPERLMFLKALNKDIGIYTDTLTELRNTLQAQTSVSSNQYRIFVEFVDDATHNIRLSENIIQSLKKSIPKSSRLAWNQVNVDTEFINGEKIVDKPSSANAGLKFTKDEVINQLIKNRILLYLRMKGETSVDNMNIDLARKILLYLEMGNQNLAREMFKIFVANNKGDKVFADFDNGAFDAVRYDKINFQNTNTQILDKQPLIHFANPTLMNHEPVYRNSDHQLLQQMLTLHKLRI